MSSELIVRPGPSFDNLSPDILIEIMSYFRYDVVERDMDGPGEVRGWWLARATALAVALVSRSLSSIALDTLWRDMVTLQPIVQIIESSAPSPVFGFRGEGGWEIQRHPHFHQMLPRVKTYLSRIRHLKFHDLEAIEYTLWPTLMEYLKIDGPLVPGVLKLHVEWDGLDLPIHPTLIPLVSPTCQRIELISVYDNEFFADPVLHHIHRLGGNPQTLAFTGYSHHSLLSVFRSFSALRELSLNSPWKRLPGSTPSTLSTPQELLQALPNIRVLHLDLRTVHVDRNQSKATLASSLSSLSIRGGGPGLTHFLASAIMSPSLTSLNIHVRGRAIGLGWRVMFEGIAQAFPSLHRLHLSAPSSTVPILGNDLVPLFKSSLKELVLKMAQIDLSTPDVTSMLQAWPGLQELCFDCPPLLETRVLEPIAAHGVLDSIHLKLDFTRLLDPSPVVLGTIVSPRRQPQLPKLAFYRPPVLPSTLKQKTALVRNLLALFPRLDSLEFIPSYEYEEIGEELRTLLSTFRAVYQEGYRAREEEEGA
ncbi:hypothetical protein D9756_008212 [Leucocoprinus leucothites]|uniref:Uncharacterized protein n=1 Tax=Leucocoprinus leucothites TaxID=201217 RepID=A0A8H5FV86_9AGAR|nr:hypothetical protein D9756_008212 [Leucoagaricus leucothites]